jgi:hypothetical protein
MPAPVWRFPDFDPALAREIDSIAGRPELPPAPKLHQVYRAIARFYADARGAADARTVELERLSGVVQRFAADLSALLELPPGGLDDFVAGGSERIIQKVSEFAARQAPGGPTRPRLAKADEQLGRSAAELRAQRKRCSRLRLKLEALAAEREPEQSPSGGAVEPGTAFAGCWDERLCRREEEFGRQIAAVGGQVAAAATGIASSEFVVAGLRKLLRPAKAHGAGDAEELSQSLAEAQAEAQLARAEARALRQENKALQGDILALAAEGRDPTGRDREAALKEQLHRAKVRHEKEKQRIFAMAADTFIALVEAAEPIDEASYRRLLARVQCQLAKLSQADLAVRRLVGAAPDQPTEDAVTRRIV